MKVGQYARYDSTNGFYKISIYDNDDCILISLDKKREFNVNPNRIKVANTPQELIQVGDLVKERHGYIGEVATKHEAFINTDSETIFLNHIVIIYTQDNNGNYIKQWERQ